MGREGFYVNCLFTLLIRWLIGSWSWVPTAQHHQSTEYLLHITGPVKDQN